MMFFSRMVLVAFMAWGFVAFAQELNPAATTVDMPSDRTDSYDFYSRLIPVGESANKGWPHELYLVEDLTRQMVPDGKPCAPESVDGKRNYTNATNPHDAVTPPEADRQDYLEILADFDAHCHERVRLDPYAWKVTVPLQLLNAQEQKEFRSLRFGPPPSDSKVKVELAAKYQGAHGLYTFSEVYFNVHHTVALVYAGVWCGGLCGHWFWSTFRLKDGQWVPIHWNSTITMS